MHLTAHPVASRFAGYAPDTFSKIGAPPSSRSRQRNPFKLFQCLSIQCSISMSDSISGVPRFFKAVLMNSIQAYPHQHQQAPIGSLPLRLKFGATHLNVTPHSLKYFKCTGADPTFRGRSTYQDRSKEKNKIEELNLGSSRRGS